MFALSTPRSSSHTAGIRVAVATVVVGALAGCAIGGTRDGIGQTCADDAPCPADHVCVLDAPTADAPGAGVCAPVLDYGACPAPTWPVRVERAIDSGRDVTERGALLDLDGVRRVQGELRLHPATVAGALVVGDLCPLAGLQHVDGVLVVRNTDIDALDGLQSLGSVLGGVAIVDNARLVDVRGLANLQFAPPPDGLAFGVFLGSNRQLEPAAVEELRAALEPAGVRVVGCGNKGERDCDGTFAPVLAEARRR